MPLAGAARHITEIPNPMRDILALKESSDWGKVSHAQRHCGSRHYPFRHADSGR
jgi:hypothetical protein